MSERFVLKKGCEISKDTEETKHTLNFKTCLYLFSDCNLVNVVIKFSRPLLH